MQMVPPLALGVKGGYSRLYDLRNDEQAKPCGPVQAAAAIRLQCSLHRIVLLHCFNHPRLQLDWFVGSGWNDAVHLFPGRLAMQV